MILENVTINWCKLLGKPVEVNFNEDGYQWSVDLVLSKAHQKQLLSENLGDYFKVNKETKDTYYKYIRQGVKKDKEPNNPVPIFDRFGNPWDPEKLIGNGTTADVEYLMMEMSSGKNKGKCKPVVLRIKIVDHVAYERPGGLSFDQDTSESFAELEDDQEWDTNED